MRSPRHPKQNPYLKYLASRMAERAELFHQAALFQVEVAKTILMSQAGITAQRQAGDSYEQAQIAVGYSQQALKIEGELIKLCDKHPTLEIVPTNYSKNYHLRELTELIESDNQDANPKLPNTDRDTVDALGDTLKKITAKS
jgi:hypothetical protein